MKKHETVDLRRLDSAPIGDATRDILYRTNGWDLADWRVAERRVYARSPEALERRRRFDIGGLAPQSRQDGRGPALPLQA